MFQGLTAGEYTLSLMQPIDDWTMSPRTGVVAGSTDVRVVLERVVSPRPSLGR